MKKLFSYTLLTLAVLALSGCEGTDLDGLDPINAVPADGAINNLKSASAAMAGLYHQVQMIFNEEEIISEPSYTAYLGMAQTYSDEAIYTGADATAREYDELNVRPSNTVNSTIFSVFYRIINTANSLVVLIPEVDDITLSQDQINSFVGEARMIRALCYFYLTSYYGDVPLVITPTIEVGDELNVSNSTQSNIYSQIIDDLKFAESNITETDTKRATSAAASALLARVYLYQQDWNNALSHAEKNIGGTFDLTTIPYMEDEIFYIGYATADGNIINFYYGPGAPVGGNHNIEPSTKFLSSYEAGDLRKDLSVDESLSQVSTPYVIKYDDFAAGASGTGTDPIMLFRYAEQLLIAAEAAAENMDFTKANLYYNQVRSRASLPSQTLDATNFEDLILQERFIELSFEGPHRWLDLKRRGKATTEISGYQSCNNVWPIPVREIDRNPNMVQNNCCDC
ncbi:MAG: RagB/SusD family nutrient uptake outer membrane protein [Bacteroidia bacterium]|nr:RagB/SusD family nutrient uptake outer membrane protein [Bacteroidia bacterium]